MQAEIGPLAVLGPEGPRHIPGTTVELAPRPWGRSRVDVIYVSLDGVIRVVPGRPAWLFAEPSSVPIGGMPLHTVFLRPTFVTQVLDIWHRLRGG